MLSIPCFPCAENLRESCPLDTKVIFCHSAQVCDPYISICRTCDGNFISIPNERVKVVLLPISEILPVVMDGCLFGLVHAVMKTMVDKICAFTTSSHYHGD